MAESSPAVKSALARFFGHRFFLPLTICTIAFVLTSATFFHFAESADNPKIDDFWASLSWVISGIPFFGRVTTEPITTRGTIVAIVTHASGLVLFALWVALIGNALFGSRNGSEN